MPQPGIEGWCGGKERAMTEERQARSAELAEILRHMGSLLVAFSGGVDSSFLLASAVHVLGDRVVAATARSELYPEAELRQARELAAKLGVRHIVFTSDEMARPAFASTPPNRCYYCKRELFGKLAEMARDEGMDWVAHAAHTDDLTDHRPGLQAADELGIRAPLVEAGLSKDDIRALARDLGLPVWDKPAQACLASRIPYGDCITGAKVAQVEAAEEALRRQGFQQLRVRHHGSVARIEVPPAELPRLLDEEMRSRIVRDLQAAGFTYVTLDLQGFRSGSMNEVLGADPDAV